MGQSLQLNSTTICEHLCWQEPKLRKKCTNTRVPCNKRLLGKLSHIAVSPHFPSRLGHRSYVLVETRVEPHALPHSTSDYHKDGPSSTSQDVQNELNGRDERCSNNPINDVHNEHDGDDLCISSSSSAAVTCVNGVRSEQSGAYARIDGVQTAQSEPYTCPDGVQNEKSGVHANATSHLISDDVQLAGQCECTSKKLSNVATDVDVEGLATGTTGALQDVKSSRNSSNTEKVGARGKIRRFSLNEPGLLKTLQKARTLTPFEQENLELLMKFKLMNDNLQGQLVIRAVRTEQLRDLESLLTDSYAELMWGPLTYRPVLAWILSTYLRERQAYLPHAVTLVGLYAPSDDSNDAEVSSHKWWLAGAVEISFNASGKPKDMQTPIPPEDAPFLSNMAVLKRFRRRGIGRELLKAAEQLVVQMGGNEMYLHCRMIDEAPLNMYKNAGYAVVETDSILSLFLFQRRRHLMYKTLPAPMCQEIIVPMDQTSKA